MLCVRFQVPSPVGTRLFFCFFLFQTPFSVSMWTQASHKMLLWGSSWAKQTIPHLRGWPETSGIMHLLKKNIIVFYFLHCVSCWLFLFVFRPSRPEEERLHARQGDVPAGRAAKPGGRSQRVTSIHETDAVIVYLKKKYICVCIYTYRLIFSRRQEAQPPNQLEESRVTMRISACRLSPVCVGPTTIHPSSPFGLFFTYIYIYIHLSI